MEQEFITVTGARENNLKDVDVRIPKRKLTVFTGVSGSGKTSLLFGTNRSGSSTKPTPVSYRASCKPHLAPTWTAWKG